LAFSKVYVPGEMFTDTRERQGEVAITVQGAGVYRRMEEEEEEEGEIYKGRGRWLLIP
jgi:hypothetical protein